ncbi:MAG TPA: alpha-glucan family phosphorylase [Acidimicrobiia bacterium]|nr:alpha-glucan family phosphorylase [Acidimicrobiia bacterium]
MDPASVSEALHRLAANHRWTWVPSCRRLLFSLPGATPQTHPFSVVKGLTPGQIETIATDPTSTTAIEEELADLERVLAGRTEPDIAYCSPEFGISAVLPQYSGGLGVLAGDHLKASSDLGTPLIGVGLFYRHGYFTQTIEDGRQAETYPVVAPEDVGADDTGVAVSIPFPDREVQARVWRMEIGRIALLLLDTDFEANDEADRRICDCLYGGDSGHRLDQEMVLGVGGARALAALGHQTPVHHLNEGHAGFIALELIDRVIEDGDLSAAIARIGPGLVFTTHTPVPAGIDRFDRELVSGYLEPWALRWGVDLEDMWALGEDPEDPTQFNMAAFSLRLCGTANGVSTLHGEVSRSLFAGVGIGDQITSITNGVHARTWVGEETQRVFDETLGPTWSEGNQAAWDRVDLIDDELLGRIRRNASLRLADLVSAVTGHTLDPASLIVGFARRFAPYKRATLLLHPNHRLRELLDDDQRPMTFLFAGKAHPLDEPGKEMLAEIVGYSSSEDANNRLIFLPGYDMDLAATLVEGCDLWLNNPIRPREASGTSGEKAALNGGLNCSILDGWWAEMYDGDNGWTIASSDDPDPEKRDELEAVSLHDTLISIRDEYHDDRPRFQQRIRHAWRTLGPRVTAGRMVTDYTDHIYRPVLERVRSTAPD